MAKKETTPVYTELYDRGLQQAVDFATASLKGIFRKNSGLPYVSHCFNVLELVRSWGIVNLETLQTCLNHDSFEENPKVTDAMMVISIGEVATGYCRELTFIPDPSWTNIQKQKAKDEYMQSFMTKSIPSLVVKCADRICNTRDFLVGEPSYAPKYWEKAQMLYHTMIARMPEIEGKFPGSGLFMKLSKDRMEEALRNKRVEIIV